ncbi:ComC/BlpC family leader-containing pheromone/bacteriocin [Streptococcus sobrinus]|nr:ComC/BlpC family leader-containing pheromone/bacteriocin [Streptococcus sobrinus]
MKIMNYVELTTDELAAIEGGNILHSIGNAFSSAYHGLVDGWNKH